MINEIFTKYNFNINLKKILHLMIRGYFMDFLNQIKLQIERGKLNDSSIMLDTLLKSNTSNPLVFNLSGILDIRLKRFNEAINKFKKAIDLDGEYAEAYFNLGNLSHNLGKLNEAENFLINAIKYKRNYVRAIYVLGDNYYLQDKIELAIKSYLNVLDIQPDNNDGFVKVLDLLTFYKNDIKIDDDIINVNYAIEKINHKIDLHNKIHDDQIKIIYKDILSILPSKLIKHQSISSQTLKKNKIDLNCGRHHAIFNKNHIIPEYCFSCFKIQIDTKNVIDLIKLYFVFNNLELENNNFRKCFIETRKMITGTYKGLIYCSDLDEVDKVINRLTPILKKTIDKNIIINKKRGCSEFGNKFKEYKTLNVEKLMSYDNGWKKYENNFDSNQTVKYKLEKGIFYSSKKVLNLQDSLTILNWLRYAKKIGDLSYLHLIDIELPPSYPLDLQLSLQIDYRINQFRKNS